MFQFVESIKNVKRVIVDYTKKEFQNSQKELFEVKAQIANLFNQI
jgi:hypothetical protein